jgi:hypothetical protein
MLNLFKKKEVITNYKGEISYKELRTSHEAIFLKFAMLIKRGRTKDVLKGIFNISRMRSNHKDVVYSPRLASFLLHATQTLFLL